MNALTAKTKEFIELYQQKDPLAALTDSHSDWKRDNELTEKLCILKQDILAIAPHYDINYLVKQLDEIKKGNFDDLKQYNREHRIEMMYAQYKRQYGWHNLDEQDQQFEKQYGDLWLQHQDDIWEQVCPKHRANKYARQAIADSKIVEVCHD